MMLSQIEAQISAQTAQAALNAEYFIKQSIIREIKKKKSNFN